MPSAESWPPKGLARPAQRALANAGVASLGELAERTEREIAALHGMGPNAVKTVRAALDAEGLSFRA